LTSVKLEAGGTIPFDRQWAIENGARRFEPERPAYLPKIHFLMLMRDERLALIDVRFDEASETLTIYRDGKAVVRGVLSTATGRLVLEQFFAAFMKDSLRGAPRIVSAPGHSFSDTRAKCLHIINLASARELERVLGRPVDPLRFRPNLIVEGPEAREERTWIGRELRAGGVRLFIEEPTERCAATNVDPRTGARDMDIPASLMATWGHAEFGVYARVSGAGTISVGDPFG
jgi:uncharacterized protein YcbX